MTEKEVFKNNIPFNSMLKQLKAQFSTLLIMKSFILTTIEIIIFSSKQQLFAIHISHKNKTIV
jgi:hypothetical protein